MSHKKQFLFIYLRSPIEIRTLFYNGDLATVAAVSIVLYCKTWYRSDTM